MEREELEKLEQDLDNIRAWILYYKDREKSERDRAERAKYKRRLKFLRLLERREKDKISRHHLARRIKQWKEELASTAIDSAPRVPGYSSRRQFVEKLFQAGMEQGPFLDAKILQNEFDFSQWILEFDGWEVLDEISKRPPAESAATVQSESREQRSVRRTEALKPLLQKKGWTPSRLATEAGVGKNSVTHYLNGIRKTITPKNRQAIADALEVKLEQIPK